MDGFEYLDSEAFCEGVALRDIAQKFGTPLYVYSESTLVGHCQRFQASFTHYPTLICYAVKANTNRSVLKSIFSCGMGADVVSVGELERSLLAEAPPNKIVFSGVGKREDELVRALEVDILSFNAESEQELFLLDSIARQKGKVASVSLRVNPDIEAKTHPHIATGLYSTKFGLPEQEIDRIANGLLAAKGVRLIGLACHLGSQIMELGPYQKASLRMVELARKLQASGHPLKLLNLGGGLGVRYQTEDPPSLENYAKALTDPLSSSQLTLVIEPGRSIVGNAGIIVTEVLGIKKTPKKTFVVVDAAMNDLIRPALYQAVHAILPVRKSPGSTVLVDVVGPVCETGDTLGEDRTLPELKPGDLLFIRTCGAYGASMGSRYNSRPLPAEVMVRGKETRLIRKREPLEALWTGEI